MSESPFVIAPPALTVDPTNIGSTGPPITVSLPPMVVVPVMYAFPFIESVEPGVELFIPILPLFTSTVKTDVS